MRHQRCTALYALLVAAELLFSPNPVTAAPYGDGDNSGRVDIADAILAGAVAAGFASVDAAVAPILDVHPYPGTESRRIGDGMVNLLDVSRIMRHAVGLSTQKQFAPLLVTDIAGDWEGQWHNITYNSAGGILATFTVDQEAKTVTMWCDFSGGVFGVGDPPPRSGTMPYTDDGFQMDTISPFFGHITGGLSYDSTITGLVTNVPSPFIERMTVNGTASPWRMDGLYTVFFRGSPDQAEGEWYIEKK